eukprot:gene16721-19862_t
MLSAVAQDLDAVAGLDNDLGTGSPWDFLTETAAVPRSPSSPVHQRPASVPVSERYDSYGRLKPAARARLSLLPGLSHENVVAAGAGVGGVAHWGSWEQLGPRQVCALALALPMHKFVTTVILSKNKIDDVCCEMLTAGLRLHAVTKHLDVSYNALTHKGAKLISNLLKRSQDGPHPFKPVMESLNIERNQVGDRGISILSENLSSHLSTLKHFNIAKCGVGPRPMDCRHVHFLVWMTFGSRRACLRGLANGKHAGLGGDFT